MENTQIPKKALNAKFKGTRTAGRPRGRWEDALRRDAAGMIKCCNWKRAANDRTTWRQKIEEAKARYGPYGHWMDGFRLNIINQDLALHL
jgi:hypothetical protein